MERGLAAGVGFRLCFTLSATRAGPFPPPRPGLLVCKIRGVRLSLGFSASTARENVWSTSVPRVTRGEDPCGSDGQDPLHVSCASP